MNFVINPAKPESVELKLQQNQHGSICIMARNVESELWHCLGVFKDGCLILKPLLKPQADALRIIRLNDGAIKTTVDTRHS